MISGRVILNEEAPEPLSSEVKNSTSPAFATFCVTELATSALTAKFVKFVFGFERRRRVVFVNLPFLLERAMTSATGQVPH